MNALPLHSVRGLRTLHNIEMRQPYDGKCRKGRHFSPRGMGMPHKLKGARDLKSLRELLLLLLLGNCNYICKIQELKAN